MRMFAPLALAITLAAPLAAVPTAASAATWYPLKVDATKADGSEGTFDYSPPAKASKDWLVCVSVPHIGPLL